MGREMFDVYKHKVKISTRLGEKEFELLPLSGRYYKKLMSVVSKFPQKEDDQDKFIENLDEDMVGKLHELCFETLKYSEKVTEPKELEQLDLFVSQNMMQLLPGVIEVNVGSQGE